ncbi:MFS transporter [Brevibacillus choshinensis]|uniref:MFS transporter n=1 Tax=Brevibacillus choshinensis TaxID=54911 RepID=A0ABX7FX36_BRECH|nr:MFS transporter [Brevibacillus choshinensis]QRG70365.1 MFS transporter [Brevibacillus choshinensis]
MKQALNSNIVLLFSSYYLKTIAYGIAYFASIALVMDISNNPVHVGMITMLETLPFMLFSAFAGVLADRCNRKALIIGSYLFLAVAISAASLAQTLWALYLLAFATGTAYSFSFPAKRALQPSLVEEKLYLELNSLDAMLKSIFQIIRPAFAGLVVAFFGVHQAFLLAGVLCIIAVVLMLPIHAPGPEKKPEPLEKQSRRKVGLHDFFEGVRLIRQEASLTYLIFVQLLVTFVMSMQAALTFLHVEAHFQGYGDTETIVGLLFSVTGIGGLLGAVFMRKMLGHIRMIPLFLLSLALDGFLVIIFAVSKDLIAVVAIWIFLGVIGTVNGIVTETVVQSTVDPAMRGRVYGILSTCSEPVSLLSTGVGTSLAALVGSKMVFLFAGASEVVVALFGRFLPSYHRLNQRMNQSDETQSK